ncbi:MAG: WecB/TagA/CpsF family glycosyltransferase, partial [Acidobacteriota bacterium]|nr:WecB/TagA/CpsF family glycosyltransferase [Acidobacteriota bacterium]
GSSDGYFDNDNEAARRVAESGARLLFVGMPSPRKERFLHQQRSVLGSIFSMGVGGSFDVWAGNVRRAPRWMQRVGLEWAYRLLQEPRRLWKRYLIGNLRFGWIVLASRFSGRMETKEC